MIYLGKALIHVYRVAVQLHLSFSSTEELPQDEDDKETIPAISPVDEHHRNFSYWVKADDNYYQRQNKNNKAMQLPPNQQPQLPGDASPDPSSRASSKSVRFDDPLRNNPVMQRSRSKGHGFDPNDPSCYPLTGGPGGGGGMKEEESLVDYASAAGRKGIPCYDTQDGILV